MAEELHEEIALFNSVPMIFKRQSQLFRLSFFPVSSLSCADNQKNNAGCS